MSALVFRPRPLGIALGLALPLLGSPVLAQDAAPKTLDTVTVSAPREEIAERQQSPIQKIVVSEEEVERYGDGSVGDVLRRLPGMLFTGPAGVAKDIRARGLDKGYTQFLINGEPVPGATKERQMQVDRLPADMIERIELIRNPSAEYDAGGIGGIINIVLKQNAEDFTRLRASYGKNGSMDTGDAVLRWSRKFEQVDVALGLSHVKGTENVIESKDAYNTSGALTSREHKPKPVEKGETLLTPRITWRIDPSRRLVLEPFVSDGYENKVETSRIVNAAGTPTTSADKTEEKDDRISRFATRYEEQRGWGDWGVKAGFQQTTLDKLTRTDTLTHSNNSIKRVVDDEKITDQESWLGGNTRLKLGQNHTLKAGAELRLASYDADKRQTTNGASSSNAKERYEIDEDRTSLHLLDEWKLGRHLLSPGLRYEISEREARDSNAQSRSNSEHHALPSLHYRWSLTDNLNLRASAAKTVKRPKYDQLNPYVTTSDGTLAKPDSAGNPDLRIERANGYEFGFEQAFWNNSGLLGLNFYYREVKDFLEKQTRLEGSRWVSRHYNVSEAEFKGFEIDWRLPVLNDKTQQLSVSGNFSRTLGRAWNQSAGVWRDVKDMPRYTANFNTDWAHRKSGVAAGFALNYMPRVTNSALNDDGVNEVKTRNESILLDLYIGKRLAPNTELRLTGKNLLAVEKIEYTVKNGAGEYKVEKSEPSFALALEHKF